MAADERILHYLRCPTRACKLVLEAGSGAKNMEIKYTGLREGEKLYEEVLNELEGTKPTFHEKIHIAQVREYDFDEVSREIDDLVETAKTFDKMETVRKMKHIVPEYKSNNSVYEVLDGEGGILMVEV